MLVEMKVSFEELIAAIKQLPDDLKAQLATEANLPPASNLMPLSPAERKAIIDAGTLSIPLSGERLMQGTQKKGYSSPPLLTPQEIEALWDAATVSIPLLNEPSMRREDWYDDDGR